MSSSRLNDQLEQILLDDRLEPIILNQVTLREHSASMSVDVIGIEQRTTAIHVDGIAFSGLQEGGWNQRCDYLLIVSSGSAYRAALVELKKNLTEEAKPLEQLRHSLPYLEYLRMLCCIHYNETAPARIQVRYAVIGEKSQLRFDKQGALSPQHHPVRRA